jgi:hypothetical protein
MFLRQPGELGKMGQRRASSRTLIIIGLILSVFGAIFFLLSDTLFGDTDVAYSLMFFGLILLPLGVIIVLLGIFELLFKMVQGWITKK